MRITIIAIGSRGDVQPLLALAVGLQQTGRHRICFAGPDNFESLVREHHIDFVPLGINTQELLGSRHLKNGVETGHNPFLWFLHILRLIKPTIDRIMERTWLSCQNAETIVYSTIGIGAHHVAEKLGIPCFIATPLPGLAPTRSFPNPGSVFPALPLGGGYNLATYYLNGQILQTLTGQYINRWRREKLNLPAISLGKNPYSQLHGKPVPVLGSFSPLVVPRPSDWGEHIHVTGYWFLPPNEDWQPPARLVEFLNSGSPPVYIGFGSMSNSNPRQTAQLVCESLEQSGQRGVLATGWGGLDCVKMPDNIYILDSIPHNWLFRQVSAVVHHGGSGTTGAGLRAGVPSILVPQMGDQPFWAKRVAELGVSPLPIPRRKLTSKRLADAINKTIIDSDLRTRAAALGERIRAEDGVKQAIEIIEGGN